MAVAAASGAAKASARRYGTPSARTASLTPNAAKNRLAAMPKMSSTTRPAPTPKSSETFISCPMSARRPSPNRRAAITCVAVAHPLNSMPAAMLIDEATAAAASASVETRLIIAVSTRPSAIWVRFATAIG